MVPGHLGSVDQDCVDSWTKGDGVDAGQQRHQACLEDAPGTCYNQGAAEDTTIALGRSARALDMDWRDTGESPGAAGDGPKDTE